MPTSLRRSRLARTAIAALFLTAGCTGVPAGVEPVGNFELPRYLGTWYEIARLDHSFERGLEDVSATYSLREDGEIQVRNRGFDPEAGAWQEAIGRARPLGDPTVASLEVSFFGPFFGGYHVIGLDSVDYGVALVSGPTREQLWILARTRTLSAEQRERWVGIARDAGYAVDDLIWVTQTRDDPALER